MEIIPEKLERTYSDIILANRNLSNKEIDEHIESIHAHIRTIIDSTVTKYKPQDKVLNYVTRKIKRMHEYKSSLITQINKSYHHNPKSRPPPLRTNYLKTLLNNVNDAIKAEYRKSYTAYWNTLVQQIDHTKPEKFFPRIKRFFRPKSTQKIGELIVGPDNSHLLIRCNIDPTTCTQQDGKFILISTQDIINILGAYFETINAPAT